MPDSLSAEPLIEKEEAEWHESKPKHTKTSRRFFVFTFLQFVTICLIPVAYYLGHREGGKALPKLPTNSVSHKGHVLQLQKLDDDFDVTDPSNLKYKGLPRPELDEAWDSLMSHMNIRVHPNEAKQSKFASVELNDGSGDLFGMPAVFHGLHCLKTLRRIQFPEYYKEEWEQYKPPFAGGINDHVDHCIDNLRQALMCQGDLSLYRYIWKPARAKPMPIAKMDHVCVNWDNVMAWATERSFSLDEGLLQAPDADKPWVPER